LVFSTHSCRKAGSVDFQIETERCYLHPEVLKEIIEWVFQHIQHCENKSMRFEVLAGESIAQNLELNFLEDAKYPFITFSTFS